MAQQHARLPLAGIKVIDFTQVYMGAELHPASR